MQKAVTFVGNSVALILDRTICEVIGVGVGSIVNVTFEGRRLIIEPTGRMKLAPPRRRRSKGPTLRSRRTIRSIADMRLPVWSPDRDETGEIPLHILARENVQVVEELTRHWHLNERRIRALDYKPFTTYLAALIRLNNLKIVDGSEQDLAVARRLRFVFEELESFDDWDRVIALAVTRYPIESSEPMSTGNGAVAVTLPPSG